MACVVGAVVYGVGLAQTYSAGGHFGGRSNFQAYRYVTEPVATTSTEFEVLWELSLDEINQFGARGPITVDLSVEVEGAPVEFRVRTTGNREMKPGTVTFAAGAEPDARSFTFASRGTAKARCHYYVVEWRSPTGAEVRVNRGSAHLVLRAPRPPIDCV
ncbi:MAG TPA: hypothetical protein VHJ76_04990 [Actinomycetota bacterium]|nr:hypothetical protein [Actinomycetota bacterium]